MDNIRLTLLMLRTAGLRSANDRHRRPHTLQRAQRHRDRQRQQGKCKTSRPGPSLLTHTKVHTAALACTICIPALQRTSPMTSQRGRCLPASVADASCSQPLRT